MAQAEERSVSYILLRWIQVGAQNEAQGLSSHSPVGSGAGADEKAQKSSEVVPFSGALAGEVASVALVAESPREGSKTPGAQSIPGGPRIRVGSSLNGGEVLRHQAQTISGAPASSIEDLRIDSVIRAINATPPPENFPGMSGTPINTEPFHPEPSTCAIKYTPEPAKVTSKLGKAQKKPKPILPPRSIPGVTTAAELPTPPKEKHCPSCGAIRGMHQKGCKESRK